MRLNVRYTYRGWAFPVKVQHVGERLVVCGENEIRVHPFLTDTEIQLAYHILRDLIRQNIVTDWCQYEFGLEQRRDVKIVFWNRSTQLDLIYVKTTNNYTVRIRQHRVDGLGRYFTRTMYEESGLNYSDLYQPIKQLYDDKLFQADV